MHPSSKQSSHLGRPLGGVFKYQCMSARGMSPGSCPLGTWSWDDGSSSWISSLLIFSMTMMVWFSMGHDVAYTWTVKQFHCLFQHVLAPITDWLHHRNCESGNNLNHQGGILTKCPYWGEPKRAPPSGVADEMYHMLFRKSLASLILVSCVNLKMIHRGVEYTNHE